jgi:hypothetical protein
MAVGDGFFVDGELKFVNSTNVDNTPDWIDGELRPYYQEVEEVGGNAPTGVFYGPLSGCLDGPI